MTYNKAPGGKFYAALSDISAGMLNGDPSRDKGGPNHIAVAAHKCGCVMELDVDQSTMRLTKARMLVCGKPLTDAGSLLKIGDYDNSCDPNGIASPDNVAVIPGYNQVSAVSESVIMQYACTEPQWYLMLFVFSSASHR